jgi:hypothetical protein
MLPQGQLGIAAGFQSLLALVNDDPEAHTLFVSMRGEEYFHMGLAGIDDPYDFVLPERPDLAVVPGRAIVPLDIVTAQLARNLSRTLLTLTAIRKLCPRLQVVRIPAPPPSSSDDVAAWSTAHAKPEPTQEVPTSVRLKLWLLYARLLEQGTAGLGLDALPVPEAAVHPIGMLRAEHMEDPIHGNAHYGALVCAQMAAVVSEAMEGAT